MSLHLRSVTTARPRLHATLGVSLIVLVVLGVLGPGDVAARSPRTVASLSHAFTLMAARTPRVVNRDQANVVSVTIRNDGGETWEASRGFALSYHWRTLTDGVAQWDGARTPLGRPVPRGQAITLQAELEPPPGPGVYFLQWDMVQEGVTWFSQKSPAPLSSTLVIVLPGAGVARAALSAVPAALAALGLLFLALLDRRAPGRDGLAPRRGRVLRFAAWSLPAWDLAWCASSLFVKQVTLLPAAQLRLAGTGILISLVTSLVPALFLLAAVRGQVRPRAAWFVAAAGSLVLLADVVYYRFFGDVLSGAALAAVPQAGQLGGSIRSLLRAEDAWLGLDLLVAWPFLSKLAPRLPGGLAWRPRLVAAAGLLAGLLVATPSPLSAALGRKGADEMFRHMNVVQQLGVFGYHLDDGIRYAEATVFKRAPSEEEIAEARDWFARHARERAGVGPHFGAARGRSVILILVESLQGFVPGLRINGVEITPTLNRLRGESLWSTHVVDQVGEGRTSDAELLNAASLLPLPRGAAAFQYPANHFVSLPQVLAARGYSTYSAVPFDGGFWNRSVTHPGYGFSRSSFAADFRPGAEVGWGLNDRAFLQQVLPRLRALPRPFCAWLITLSLHHPFSSFPQSLRSLDLGRWNGTPLGNYLEAMHLFDKGLADLVAGLREGGVLDDTVLVVEGDHEAGAPWEDVSRVAGFHHDTLDWYLADRVPLVIRVPGERAPRGELQMVPGQADVVPTLLALLGVDPAPLPFVGRNLLGAPSDRPVVRRYGDWLDSRHLYLAGQGYTPRQACFDIALRREVPLAECAAGQAEAVHQLGVSNRVLTSGLQQALAR